MKRLKLGVNARTLSSSNLRGWSRYTINLLQALCEFDIDFYLFSDRTIDEAFLRRLPRDRYTIGLQSLSRYFTWEQFALPSLARQYAVEVLHCPINYGLPWRSPCPTVLTLHDAIIEKYYGSRRPWREKLRPDVWLWSLSNWISRHRADRVITVSQHAKTDLVDFLKIPAAKVDVIYEAADLDFDVAPTPEKIAQVLQQHGVSAPYFFYVGGWEQRKNIPFLLQAFREARLEGVQMVLAGGRAAEKEKLAREFSDLANLKLLSWVEDADLPSLYAGARALVYPSEYEGFGLQLCEAMAVGCPVLVSNVSSLPEVAGAGGESFGLEDPRELVALLQRVCQDESFFNELRQRARKRSQDFSWQQTARQTYEVYRQVAGV